ncbi:methyltransferase like 15 S homeolog [Xenopus laevis]|uniref:MGC84490 protein n=1 Tax=Xenopus laevis TaxID=8355 RepID=Q6GQZ0_XENLA|nr:methyltransferase 15, mitochondrial 12S rRNA N4-cytidine S homeolog [Xenopus laevis]AAH71163.1 MGC84490 protein [Xenopus laevis]
MLASLRHVCRSYSRFRRGAPPSLLQAKEVQLTPEPPGEANQTVLHVPVMVNEVIECLAPQEGQTILDLTFGAGGHTTSILRQASNIKILALDRDPAAFAIAQQLAHGYGPNIQPLLGRFSEAEDLLKSAGVEPGSIDGVLLDAGCSSMQFDTPDRGFSLSKDGPLDMRMDGDRCFDSFSDRSSSTASTCGD